MKKINYILRPSMKRFYLLPAILLFICTTSGAQSKQRIDSLAIYILDRTSETMRSLISCSYTAFITYDTWMDSVGYIKHTSKDKVYFSFPNKMKVNMQGDMGNRSMCYDGKKFSYYSFNQNRYAELDLSLDIVQTIDSMNRKYGIELPAADFFYPSFTDDILSAGGNLVYLGVTGVQNQLCYHIAGNDVNGTVFQFWITQDHLFFPVKMVLTYKEDNGQPQYEAVYSDWEINPSFPANMFDFVAPPAADKIRMSTELSGLSKEKNNK
ncbi:MAG: DUF2092 domain-containing protein [Tannerella sp.]|nr:DUF2092 domain-containing protein [Tannerella sp.]